MTSKVEKVLYSAIKVYGTLHTLDVADIISFVKGCSVNVAKGQVRVLTSPNIPGTILKIDNQGRVNISKACPDIEDDEYIPYKKHFDIFVRWKR